MNKTKELIESTLQPMGIGLSSLYFGALSLFIAVGIHVVIPFTQRLGIITWFPYMGTLAIASTIGILLARMHYIWDIKKGILAKHSFRLRFWMPTLTLRDVLWGIGLLFFWVGTLIIIKGTLSTLLIRPSYLVSPEGTYFGMTIASNYLLLLVQGIFLGLNIVGEELFWRGYMLPRQIKVFGKLAWMINGTLWALFHLPLYWIMPTLIPGCFALAYVTQKRQSLWPALIAHFLLNGIDLLMTIMPFF